MLTPRRTQFGLAVEVELRELLKSCSNLTAAAANLQAKNPMMYAVVLNAPTLNPEMMLKENHHKILCEIVEIMKFADGDKDRRE